MSIIVINRPFQKGLVNSVMDEKRVLLQLWESTGDPVHWSS